MQELEKIKLKNILVVVEGYKDKRTLGKFGITNVITLKKPLYEIVEMISLKYKECVVLTDLDKEGKILYSRIANKLKGRGVKVRDKIRELLFETQLRQIEGLWKYLERKEKIN